ncbi:MAG: DUF1592 domain-containing protein, partial [Verrucomicrobiota bacterium]
IGFNGIEMERVYPNATRDELRAKLFPGLTAEDRPLLDDPERRGKVVAKVVRTFAQRAFRRPLDEARLRPYVELAMDELTDPATKHEEALKVAYRAILCSPRFLTLPERPGKLDDHAVATRLSYMLWNSIPDARLRQLADEGKLSHRDVRHAEVERMLKDPRANRFYAGFTDQWLNLRDINFTSPDSRMFRNWDPIVQDSMVAETRTFFQDLIERNADIRHLIDSDYVVVNSRLAHFYGLKDVKVKPGEGLQKVDLTSSQRGGVITQGAVLKVTANGTTTSPVVRGVWLAERILGRHIPPPPDNIPAVEPDIRGATTIREKLIKHQDSESCAACHKKIDPAGFAMEHFDPVGLWRSKYGTKKNAPTVDSSGETPEGDAFENFEGWRQIHRDRPDELADCFARQLLTYATGAPIRFGDRVAMSKIVTDARIKEYGMRDILHATVASDIFLNK